jgi:hypothetical protein
MLPQVCVSLGVVPLEAEVLHTRCSWISGRSSGFSSPNVTNDR